MENKLTHIICLGDSTVDTHTKSCRWAQRLQIDNCKLISDLSELQNPGVYYPDLSNFTIDHIWEACNKIDLLILLDQPVSTYSHQETYHHFEHLAIFKKRFMPVLIESTDMLDVWIENLQSNEKILSTIIDGNIHDSNLVIELYPTENLITFKNQVNQIVDELTRRNCKWVFYRASAHEAIHYEVTNYLITTHPEFVLLYPAIFTNNIKSNIIRQIYRHWVYLNARRS